MKTLRDQKLAANPHSASRWRDLWEELKALAKTKALAQTQKDKHQESDLLRRKKAQLKQLNKDKQAGTATADSSDPMPHLFVVQRKSDAMTLPRIRLDSS